MPRIVPIQLLKCLKVLLNDNGGILSTGEVKRISTLMTKYSKKLVSKCIYVQILKCTDTELLDEFMTAGGWALVYTWLTDGIRLANWPLVQEILELLLLCPVDVGRLKINAAPKMVKSLCNGTDEGVCILAKRLVEQWLKIVTEGNETSKPTIQQYSPVNQAPVPIPTTPPNLIVPKVEPLCIIKAEPITKSEERILPGDDDDDEEKDPLGVPETEARAMKSISPSKIPGKTGLVYKIVVRDGQQLLTKVEPRVETITGDLNDEDTSEMIDEHTADLIEEDDEEDEDTITDLVEEDTTSLDKLEDKESNESNGAEEKKQTEKKSVEIKAKEKNDSKEEQRSGEHRKSKDSKSKDYKSDKDKEKDKDRDRKSSSSHRSSSSSSSHKSSSSKSLSSSSSSRSSKPSSPSSSSSRRSSSDKGRNDKDRLSSSSSSSKDKDRSSSSKHKSSSSSSSKSSSSSSLSSSSKERHREKDKDRNKEKEKEKDKEKEKEKSSSSSSSSSKKDKEREKDLQAEKDKDTLAKMLPPSLDKLGKIPKKPKEEREDTAGSSNPSSSSKPTSITIPSKKASMSIEIRRDTEKTSTVKTYKSQFRSHGLTEEAPPPPSRKSLKKPSSTTTPGSVIPSSLPSSMKRPSPPPKDSPLEKKTKIDINQITPAAANIEKPGAIKLIPAKRIQTLVETNIFSDALAAATGPKKVSKRKRPNSGHKDEPTTPTSPDAPKVVPLKFYQDTLDESAAKSSNEEKSEKSKEDESKNNSSETDKENSANITDEDDDIPLKKVKEDIEKRVRKEKAAASGVPIDISDAEDESKSAEDDTVEAVRKPGPGCGPDGPPGVLMLHRRKGPKKKLTWRPQDQLEQIRYFQLDENERVNVMKVSFHDMKNMERFNERASLTNLTKRAPRPGDIQEPRTEWRPLIEVEDVPVPPDGAQSKERRVQAEREMTTLRALYFSPNMIPDSPSEAEIEPHYPGDPPLIPLDDVTGNQDAINDFSGMPWPEPKGSPMHGDNASFGTGGLGVLGNPAAEMFPTVLPNNPANIKNPFASNNNNNFINAFGPGAGSSPLGPTQMPPMPPNGWQGPPTNMPRPLLNNAFQGGHSKPDMMPGGPNFMPPHGQFNGPPPPPQFIQNRNGPFGPPPPAFNGPNFGPMGPMNNMGGPVPLMNNMNNAPRGANNMRNNNGPNWCNGPNNFQDNMNSGGNWRPAGTGPNRSGGNNGVCKAFMRGNCRLGKSCKFIHPKNKRL